MDAEQQRAAQTALKKSISSALTKLSTVGGVYQAARQPLNNS